MAPISDRMPTAARLDRFAEWWRAGVVARLIRLAMVAAAVAFGTAAYFEHLDPLAAWTQWAAALAAGVGLLAVAFWDGGRPSPGRVRWGIRVAAAVVAVVAGWWGADLARQPGRELEAAVAIVAALAGFLIFRWVWFSPADARALLGDCDAGVLAGVSVGRAVVLSAVAVVSAAAAVVLNPTHHLLGFALWLCSLAALAAAFWRRRPPDRAPRWQVEAGPPLAPREECIALFAILLFAAALRVTVLDAVPAWINPDEGRLGRYAERMWAHGFPDAFGLGWNGFPHLSYMLHYVWVQVLGPSNPHLRLSAATVGVLSLVPMFYWARFWWGNIIALIAAFLLAINQTHLMWSRIGFNNIHQVLIAATILLCFARVLRRNAAIDWVWLGIAAGLGFHTYHAAKLYPLLLVPVGLVIAFAVRGFLRRCLPGLAIGALAFALCLGPLIRTTIERWDFFYLSTSNRIDLHQLVAAHDAGDVRSVRHYIADHVGSSLFAFSKVPTPEEAYLSIYVSVPFALGVGWLLWRWRDPRHLTVLVWIAGILVIGGMITDYPPATTRMLGFFPAVCVVPAIVAGRLRALLCGWRWGGRIFAALLAVWLTATAWTTWHHFFVTAPPLQRGQPLAEICRVIRAAPLPSTLYMVGGDLEAELEVVRHDCMVEADDRRRLVNLPRDAAVVPLPPDHSGSGFILVSHFQRELVPLIRAAYPEARYEVVYDRAGVDMLHVFELTPRAIAAHRGLRAEYRTASGYRLADRATARLDVPPDAEIPGLVQWRGRIFIPQPGEYAFRTDAGELRVDGRWAPADSALPLAAGWHAIEVAHELTAPRDAPVSLQWRRDGDWSDVPAPYLNDQRSPGGLLGRYFDRAIGDAGATPIEAPAEYESIEPALSFRYRAQSDEDPPPPFAARPSTMEWVGSVDFAGRPRRLRLQATTPTQVYVDGTLVAALRSGEVTVDLSPPPGRVPFLIRNVRPADDDWRYWALRLLWQEPGRDWSATLGYDLPP